MKNPDNTTVAIIGAGPVGLAAAAHLLERGLQPLILEKGHSAGHAMLAWGHVKVFTPWKYITDKAVVSLLKKKDWQHPAEEHLPTAREIVEEYLAPAATETPIKDAIRYDAEVVSVSKLGLSKSSSTGREEAPYTIHYKTASGEQHVALAQAVIDASGTWYSPNPMGTDGLPVAGELTNSDVITYGIPDVLGDERDGYAGKRTLVLGGGHSSINTALDLLHLRDASPCTKIFWGLRRNNIDKLLGGGINDELPARGALGLAAKKAIDEDALEVLAPLTISKVKKTESGLQINALINNNPYNFEVDRVIVTTGFRPDLEMLREIRLGIDDTVEAPATLAPLIDPNLHSCGTVPPHGVDELSHPDKNFFIVGMKAYGRAPTFLMLTGYEQVRSIADELAGNHEAARQIQLVLPETGVCNVDLGEKSGGLACCGTTAPDPDKLFKETLTTANATEIISQTDISPKSSCCTPIPEQTDASSTSSPCCQEAAALEEADSEVSSCC